VQKISFIWTFFQKIWAVKVRYLSGISRQKYILERSKQRWNKRADDGSMHRNWQFSACSHVSWIKRDCSFKKILFQRPLNFAKYYEFCEQFMTTWTNKAHSTDSLTLSVKPLIFFQNIILYCMFCESFAGFEAFYDLISLWIQFDQNDPGLASRTTLNQLLELHCA